MEREKFIELVHSENHGVENDYQTFDIFPKDSFFSEEIIEDLSETMLNLYKKTNNALKKIINKDIEYNSFCLDLINEKSIISTYKGNFLAMPYNKIYDYLIDKEIIKNNETTKILRIEDENGLGLYRAMENIGASISDYFDFSRNIQPAPMEDEILASLYHNEAEDRELLKTWYFGFKNKNQIFKWLEEDKEESIYDFIIKKNPKMLVVQYEVPKSQMLKSDKQVVFKKDCSKVLNKYKLKDFKEIESLEIKKELENKSKIKKTKKNKIS